MLKIQEHLYGILTYGGYLNYYVIASGDALAVIDIGLGKGDVNRLERELAAHNWSLEQVQYILITHAHPDHIGGLAELQRRCNAHTCAGRLDAPVVRGDQISPTANLSELSWFLRPIARAMANTPPRAPARVDRELSDGDTLDEVLPGLQVVGLPGHSYGQVGYWLPESRTLIGGDVMMRMPWRLTMPLRAPSPDWGEVKRSIFKVAGMNVETLCLGHGRPIIGGAAAHIQKLVSRIS